MIRITTTSVFVDDQAKALAFYTDVLGFQLKTDVPAGPFRWLTVVSPATPRTTAPGTGGAAAVTVIVLPTVDTVAPPLPVMVTLSARPFRLFTT